MDMATHDLERALIIPPAALAQLQQAGHAIVDDFLPLALADGLRAEVLQLHACRALQPNQIALLEPDPAASGTRKTVVTKPHIFERDLHTPDSREGSPTLSALFRGSCVLARALNAHLPALCLDERSPGAHTLKVQVNEGGGSFPLHFDNPGPPDARVVTCLLYLNPGWQTAHGGQVRVAPFLQPPTDVAPLHNRLLLFWSETVLHRVLPPAALRVCLTVWLSAQAEQPVAGRFVPPWPLATALDAATAAALGYLAAPALQRAVARAVYEEEFRESIQTCMAEEPAGLAVMLRSHELHVARIAAKPQLADLVQQLRAMKPSGM